MITYSYGIVNFLVILLNNSQAWPVSGYTCFYLFHKKSILALPPYFMKRGETPLRSIEYLNKEML